MRRGGNWKGGRRCDFVAFLIFRDTELSGGMQLQSFLLCITPHFIKLLKLHPSYVALILPVRGLVIFSFNRSSNNDKTFGGRYITRPLPRYLLLHRYKCVVLVFGVSSISTHGILHRGPSASLPGNQRLPQPPGQSVSRWTYKRNGKTHRFSEPAGVSTSRASTWRVNEKHCTAVLTNGMGWSTSVHRAVIPQGKSRELRAQPIRKCGWLYTDPSRLEGISTL